MTFNAEQYVKQNLLNSESPSIIYFIELKSSLAEWHVYNIQCPQKVLGQFVKFTKFS